MHTSYSLSLCRNSGSYLDRNTFSLTTMWGLSTAKNSYLLSGVDDLIHARVAVLQWIPVNPMNYKLNHRQRDYRDWSAVAKKNRLAIFKSIHTDTCIERWKHLQFARLATRATKKKNCQHSHRPSDWHFIINFSPGKPWEIRSCNSRGASRSLFQMNIYIWLSKIK